MKIAFVCDDLMLGGWSSLYALIVELKRRGHKPFAICLFGKGYYADLLEKSGIKVYLLSLNKANFVWKLVNLIKILKTEKPDIVHSNLHYSDIFGLIASFFSKVPTALVHIHSVGEKYKYQLRPLKKYLLNFAKFIICPSKATAESFVSEFPGNETKIRIVPNGIALCEFRRRCNASKYEKKDFGISEKQPVVLTVANFKWQKGLIHLVEAAEKLPDLHAKFAIAGYGPLEKEIKNAVKQRKLDEKFLFLGARTDVPELMKLADIFVLPSVDESFGISILEAMACGVPVVASAVGGIKETVTNGVNGLLVAPSAPSALAEAIKKLANEPQTREKLAQVATQSVETFDISKICDTILNVYQEKNICAG